MQRSADGPAIDTHQRHHGFRRGHEAELAKCLDHLSGLELERPSGRQIAGLERADQPLVKRTGEIVGAADRSTDSETEAGQQSFVAAEQDVERALIEGCAHLKLDQVVVRVLESDEVRDPEPRFVEEFAHRQADARHPRDMIEIERQWVGFSGDRQAALDQVMNGRRLEVRWGHHGDGRDAGLSSMSGELDRVGLAVVTDVNGDPERITGDIHPTLAHAFRSSTLSEAHSPVVPATKTALIPASRKSFACRSTIARLSCPSRRNGVCEAGISPVSKPGMGDAPARAAAGRTTARACHGGSIVMRASQRA